MPDVKRCISRHGVPRPNLRLVAECAKTLPATADAPEPYAREGQEDQLGSLGLVVNMIVLWNTIYMQAALEQLRAEGCPIVEADIAHLNPHIHAHINMLGRYSFAVPDSVARGELRPLRNPADDRP